jgi:hypothetical protein
LSDRIEDNLSTLLQRSEEILQSNRSKVLALAHALEVHRTLAGDDVAAVIDCEKGPIVDGTAYSDPKVIAALEEYHAAAVIAHKNHSTPELPLTDITSLIKPI